MKTWPTRLPWLALAALAFAGCDAADPGSELAPGASAAAPTGSAEANAVIPGQYVVVLSEARPDASSRSALAAVVAEVRARADAEVLHEYGAALTGFAARLSPEAVAALEADPRVDYVAPDRMAHIADGPGTQPGATWGLDRINQRNRPLDNTYSWQVSGQGVRVYILDTGVRTTHTDFGGQASSGYDFINNDADASDCNGHGTHVAGTVAGTTWGVAKDAQIVAVRVLDCGGSGPWSVVIAGIDWVTANAVRPAVANMSLGGSTYPAADAAVANSIASGVPYSLAAGNWSTDACTFSPARTPEGITVASTTNTDARSWFSNYGSCVDLFAPGSAITSAWYTSDNATAILDGTSMAAPHVAGVAAMYLSAFPNSTSLQVRNALYNATTKDIVSGSNSTNDHLLYNRRGG